MRSSSILMIVTIVAIGCSKVEGGGSEKTTLEHTNILNKTITATTKTQTHEEIDGEWTYVEMKLDELPFTEAFRIEHLAKGEGRTFWWRGTEYTTNLASVSFRTDDIYYEGQWVRNSDDLNDYCRSNEWDECGVCDGPGMPTWYYDNDGDGLGNPSVNVKNCNYPSVDEE